MPHIPSVIRLLSSRCLHTQRRRLIGRGVFATSLVLALTLFALGCATPLLPQPQEAIIGPLEARPQGALDSDHPLFLTQRGEWVLYASPQGAMLEGAKRGDLLLSTTPDEEGLPRPTHLFAITDLRAKGARLVRLDTAALSAGLAHDVTRISPSLASSLPELGVCSGSGALRRDHPCFSKASPHTRYHVYALRGEGDLLATENSARREGRGVERSALAHLSREGVEVFGDAPSTWLVVALPGLWPTPAHPHVVLDEACPALEPIDASHTVSRASLSALDHPDIHPLHIEAAAFEHGADVMVRCDARGERLFVPALTRAWITLKGSDALIGPPLLSARSHSVGARGSARTALIVGMGAMARSDLSLADALLAPLLEREDVDLEDDTIVGAAQLAAASARPEAALRASWRGTSSRWRRDEDLAHSVVMITIWTALGMETKRLALEGELGTKLARQPEAPLGPWVTWRKIVIDAALGQLDDPRQAREALSLFEGLEEVEQWQLASAITAAAVGALTPQESPLKAFLSPLAATYEVEELLRAAWEGDVTPLPCLSDVCPLDVYGRRFEARLGRAQAREALGATGIGWVRGGFAHPPERMALLDQITVSMFAPMSPETLETISSRLGEAMASGEMCSEEEAIRDIGLDMMARRHHLSSSHEVLGWMLTTLVYKACHSPDRLARHVSSADGARQEAGIIFWEAWVRGVRDPETKFGALRALSSLDVMGQHGASCRRGRLAMAVALLEAGDLIGANDALMRAGNCPETSSEVMERSRLLIEAWMHQETHGRLPRHFDRTLLGDTPNKNPSKRECALFASSRPPLKEAIPSEILELARDARPSSERARDPLQIMRASEASAYAKERIDVARDLLERGERSETLDALREAVSLAGGAGDEPTARRASFIGHVLFGKEWTRLIIGDAIEATDDEEEEGASKEGKSEWHDRVFSGEARALYERWRSASQRAKGEEVERLSLALIALFGSSEELRDAITRTSSTSLREELCRAERFDRL